MKWDEFLPYLHSCMNDLKTKPNVDGPSNACQGINFAQLK